MKQKQKITSKDKIWRGHRLISVITALVLIIQVVFPGGLFNFTVPKAHAAVTVTVVAPDIVTDWDIGDSNAIAWQVAGGVFSTSWYSKLYYSINSGSDWTYITTQNWINLPTQVYLWKTPVVGNAGQSTHKIRVEFYNPSDVLQATGDSDLYKIDYGPVDSYIVDIPAGSPGLTTFYMYVTAKDQYNNTIINFSGETMLYTPSLDSGPPGLTMTAFSPDPTTGPWVQGVSLVEVTNGFQVHWGSDHSDAVARVTVAGSPSGAGGYDTGDLFYDAVIIDSPTSSTTWVIGTSGNSVVFRAGGNTTIDHFDLAYSPDNGSNYYTIENGVAKGTQPQTYSWTVNNNTPGSQWKVRIKSYDVSDVLIATGTSDGFTVAYGSAASFTVVAPESANINQYFSLTVTAKDSNGYTITTFNNAVAIGSSPSNITPVTIGGTGTGTWTNGVATYNGYAIDGTGAQTITATYSGATGQTTMYIFSTESKPQGCDKEIDFKAPSSVVAGILDANNTIQPMPAYTYRSPLTVVAEAIDPDQGIMIDGCPLGTGVQKVELKLRKSSGAWTSLGNGQYIIPPANAKPGYDYYKWVINIPDKEFANYYLYSIATDWANGGAGNVESPPGPPGYDVTTLVDMRRPYVTSTNPVSGQTNVANNATVVVSFSLPMDIASVWSAFSVTKQGSAAPPNLGWSAVWTMNNQVVTLSHTTVYDYSGVYTVKIDPNIATSATGAPLDTITGAPMPFSFTVVVAPQPNKPNLSTSTKAVNLIIAPAGSALTYTIVLRNTGTATANVVFADPIPTNTTYDNQVTGGASYDAATNTIRWSGNMNRGGSRTITFRVRINTGVANGVVIVNKATFSDGFGMSFDKYANTVVNTVPSSQVIGNLDVGGNLVTPMQGYTYLSPLTVVAQGQNAATLLTVNLYYRTNATGDTVYKDFGPGVKYQDNADGSAYYKWDFPFADGLNLTYYFYSRATDAAGNVEAAPSSYDSYTRVNTIRPYISLTSPVDKAVNFPITGTSSYIRITFSAAMDRTSEMAFGFTRVDGKAIPDYTWAAAWNTGSTQLTLTHTVAFDYNTSYRVFMDPAKIKDANGKLLDNTASGAKPNPFTFTTAVLQAPDLTASVKIVDSPTVKPGAQLLFTIKVDNSLGNVNASVTLTDPLPTNTTYANYVFGGLLYNPSTKTFTWSGTVVARGSATMGFRVTANTPLDNNLNIVNIVTLKDQTNPAIQKTATTVVGSSPKWDTSSKKVQLPPDRADGKAKPGDTLAYTIKLTNTGDMNGSNMTVTDNVPANTNYVTGSSPEGGLVYDPATNTLKWTGSINVGQSQTFSYQIKLSSDNHAFQPPNDKITSQTAIVDGVAGYDLSLVTPVNVPADDPVDPKKHPQPAPYITDQIQPPMNGKSVELYSQIIVPFSKVMNPDSLQYEVLMGNFNVDTNKWSMIWSPEGDMLILDPNGPLESGETYTVHIINGSDLAGLSLTTDGPIPDNTWKFTTVRPSLYFAEPTGPISFLAGAVSPEIILKIGDWLNFAAKDLEQPIYAPYMVEKNGITLNLETTSKTGRMGQNSSGQFYTENWGPWYNNPTDPSKYLKIPAGTDSASFYYTDNATGYHSLFAADTNPGYTILDPVGKPVITSSTAMISDQIYFGSDPQQIPASTYSNPIIFGVTNQSNPVMLTAGRIFLLSSSSKTGRFYTSSKDPIDEYVTFNTNVGRQVFYKHIIQSDTMTETIYYKDPTPGSYLLTIADGETDLGTAGVTIQGGVAQSAGQNIIVLPLNITDCKDNQDCDLGALDKLTEVTDDTGRELARIDVTPVDTIILPNGAKLFVAKGYDTGGKEIGNLIFSWFVIAGGGAILKDGLTDDNHSSRFTAGRVPGVYWDTIMVVAYYNNKLLAGSATVRVARVINYGRPGELPSTGPNGIQWLFMILTLISAVALAAVEHYEKTCLSSKVRVVKP